MHRILLMLFLFLAVVPVRAAPLAFGEILPTNISDCVATGTCVVGGLVYSAPTGTNMMTAYSLTDLRSGAAESKTLVHYALDATSNSTTQYSYPPYFYPPPSSSPITGGIWLELGNQYDLSSNWHPLSIFFDQASVYHNVWPVTLTNGELRLEIQTSGLLASAGGAAAYGSNPPLGTLAAVNALGQLVNPFSGGTSCGPYGGCGGSSASLNLLNISYLVTGQIATLAFNPADGRSVLYADSSNISSTAFWDTYSVRPVPVPAALWLLLSGIISLTGFGGRRIRSQQHQVL